MWAAGEGRLEVRSGVFIYLQYTRANTSLLFTLPSLHGSSQSRLRGVWCSPTRLNARDFNARFPGFETDVHGLVRETIDGEDAYFVDVVKD